MASGFEMADGDTLLVSDTPHRPPDRRAGSFRGVERYQLMLLLHANVTENESKY